MHPNVVLKRRTPDYFYKDRHRRTPTGTELIPNQLYSSELSSFKDAVISTNAITIMKRHPRNEDGKTGRRQSVEQLSNLNKERYTGLMTSSAGYRFRKSFDALLFNARPFWTKDPDTGKPRKARMVAWTLTIPLDDGLIDGKQAWYYFKRFRDALSRQGISFPYICKLEFTENGQPHFHFNTVEYLPYSKLYGTWENVLQLGGQLHKWRANHPTGNIQGCKFLYLWTDASCDEYLWWYLKKNTQNNTPAGCRIWSCSDHLKNPPNKRISFDYDQMLALRKATSTGKCKFVSKTVKVGLQPKMNHWRVHKKVEQICTPFLFRPYTPYIIQCYEPKEVILLEKWKFKSHEDLLSFLTLTNKRLVAEHKRMFNRRLPCVDDREYIFARSYYTLPVLSEEHENSSRGDIAPAAGGTVLRSSMTAIAAEALSTRDPISVEQGVLF